MGYLIGGEHQGLACMFTMMNYERLSVGLQGLGAGELAYQQAARYARDRLQGRAATGPQNSAAPADSLLMSDRAIQVEASRLLKNPDVALMITEKRQAIQIRLLR